MQENDSRKKPYIQHHPISTGQSIYRLTLTSAPHPLKRESEDEIPCDSLTKERKIIIPVEDAKEDETPVTTATEEKLERDAVEKQQMRDTLRRLSLYPHVIQRPLCEAVVNGKTMHFQVIGKRGDQIRIKHKREILDVTIDDIQDLKILN